MYFCVTIVMVLNYCRKKLGQTGSGHFSPIGGCSLSDNEHDFVGRTDEEKYWLELQLYNQEEI